MSIIKSFSVEEGDMFYIKHNSSNFTTIDCCLKDNVRSKIVDELIVESNGKLIKRFISTHPDEDHIENLDYLDSKMKILNFYCVANNVTKENITPGFKKYCELRDGSQKYNISNGCKRKWMNKEGNDENGNFIGSSGINIHWPILSNDNFIRALGNANIGYSPNNISPIISYSISSGVKYLWMGDLEKDFIENICDSLEISKINILFAPHHGRKTGTVPSKLLEKIDPDIIIIGEAPSDELNYYNGYNTISQNTAGDITFINDNKEIHIYTSNKYDRPSNLKNKYKNDFDYYLGTLEI